MPIVNAGITSTAAAVVMPSLDKARWRSSCLTSSSCAADAWASCVSASATEATDAAKHKIDEKRADSEAEKSGPVGKAVNNVKSGYHKNRSKASADKAKQSLNNAG